VGDYCTSDCYNGSETDRTLILRWDGAKWSQTPSPSPGGSAYLYSVAAGPGGTAWAVGYSCASGCGTASEAELTLILHWDGAKWSQTPSPSPGRIMFLGGVSPGPGGTAWAVGTSCLSGCGTASEKRRTLTLRWDGAKWWLVASPSPGGDAYLTDVSTGPDRTIWAVGFTCPFCRNVPVRTLILRWDGAAWASVASPSPPGPDFLNGVSAGPGRTAWAVGYSCTSRCGTASETDSTLILHWDGTRWVAG
jgi:hypothetical protein